MKEYIKKGFGYAIGSTLGYTLIKVICDTLKPMLDKARSKTENKNESSDSQD